MERIGPAPYCGAAPGPGELLGRWNLDPWALAALAIAISVYALHRRRGGAGADGLVTAGFIALALAFVSPLCALSSALFSARTVHHAVLILLAAPLLAFGLASPRRVHLSLPVMTALHAGVLWLWHAPSAYGWALSDPLGYWLMQASLFGAAFGFWWAVRWASRLAGVGALLAFMAQMGLLGALLTFAGRPLYAPHWATSWLWGLSPLDDQQIAGLLMWAPVSALYLLVALARAAPLLGPSDREAAA